jgi:desampylase
MLRACDRQARPRRSVGVGKECPSASGHIGHYHSHPNGRAEPSPRDAARATDNGQIWFIIANDAVSAWQAVTPDGDDASLLHGRFAPMQLLTV